MAVADNHSKATGREWAGLAVLALPCVLCSMDLTVLMLAIPHLTADLAPSASQLLWITDIYGFLVAGLLITMGALGDRIGKRRLLMIGGMVFGIASMAAAFSTTAEELIIARAVLGAAGATLAPSTLSLIRTMFHDEKQRTVAIGLWVAAFSSGGAFGPLVGGIMLEHFWWGSVFLLAVPVMVLLLIAGPLLLPESRDKKASRLGLFSAALSLSCILPIIYGIKKIAEYGLGVGFVLFIVAGFCFGAAFIRRQKRMVNPFIDITLFQMPGFSVALCINMTVCFIAFGFFLLSAQYLQLVLGMGPLEAGLWTAPTGVAFAVGSTMTSTLLRYWRRVQVIVGGFTACAIGYLMLSFVAPADSLPLFMAGSIVFCLGLAPIATVTTDMIMGIAPEARAGSASALSETGFELGGAISIAVMGSLATAYYRVHMEALAGPDTPPEVLDTLAVTVLTAQSLPVEQGTLLLTQARGVFTDAMNLVAMMAGVIALIAASSAHRLLRNYDTKTKA